MSTLPDPARLRRRAELYSRRSWHTLSGRHLAEPCAFVHLPKCGGTSLAAGLYGTVPLHRRIGVIDAPSTRRAAAIAAFGRDDPRLAHEDLEHGHLTFALREQMVLTHMAWETPLIHGHFFVTETLLAHFGDRYRFVTMMRDPVARALSNYRMAVRAGVIAEDLDAWLDGPVGRSMAQAAHSAKVTPYSPTAQKALRTSAASRPMKRSDSAIFPVLRMRPATWVTAFWR